jgi:hypothetical protein
VSIKFNFKNHKRHIIWSLTDSFIHYSGYGFGEWILRQGESCKPKEKKKRKYEIYEIFFQKE